MASFFPHAHNINASQSQFTSVGGDQYNITYSADQQSVLASLKPVDRLGHYVAPCMRGTRQWIIDQIIKWLNDPQASNILWLSGSPGAGKSTIAATLVSKLVEMGRLGSSFFFKRDDATLRDPAGFWRTVAFDLAQVDRVFAERLIENVTNRRVDLTRTDIESHYKYLIKDPLMESLRRHTEALKAQAEVAKKSEDVSGKLAMQDVCAKSPIQSRVVVLDALDECGADSSQSTERRIFMETITQWSLLHPSLKFIITSRDHNITPSFRQVSHRISLNSVESAGWEKIDIRIFFEQRFAEISSKYPSLHSWPGTAIIKQLVDRAAGLFIWANTVIRFVDQGLPKQQLNLILGGAFHEEGDAIGKLYQQILRLSFNNPRERVSDTFKKVVGAIVVAKTPLHRKDLIHFLAKQKDESPIDESAIEFILNNLSTVISSRTTDSRVHISHLSFTEFVCDPTRCDSAFVIDRSTHNEIMAQACFRVMNAGLRFNICNIETSYLRNDDLNLAPRIEKAIPTPVAVAIL
jgi:hypothetical protein